MASAVYQIADALSFMRLSVGGCYTAIPGGAVIKRRLPTDPIGSATLTLVANTTLAGAEVRIYDMDNIPVGSLGTELAGVESCPGATFDYFYYYGITANRVWLQIMAPGFEEYGQEYTLTRDNTTLSVILQAELNT